MYCADLAWQWEQYDADQLREVEAAGQAFENEIGGQNATGDTADGHGMSFLHDQFELEEEEEEEHEAEEAQAIEIKEKPFKDNLARKLEELEEHDGDDEWQAEIAGEIEDLVWHFEWEWHIEQVAMEHDTVVDEPDPLHFHDIIIPSDDYDDDLGVCMDKPGHEAAGWGGCPWYAENGGCGEWEDWLKQDNCCFCGGGIWSDGEPKVEAPVCEDIPGHEAAGWGGCPWYEQNGQCGDWEDWLPAINCCFCGGGQQPKEATKDQCQDLKGHEDAGWGGCDWYEKNGECGEWEDWLPQEKCCVCGYGHDPKKEKAEKKALKVKEANQKMMDKIPDLVPANEFEKAANVTKKPAVNETIKANVTKEEKPVQVVN